MTAILSRAEADARLDKMARDAQRPGESFLKAYARVMATPEAAEIYAAAYR